MMRHGSRALAVIACFWLAGTATADNDYSRVGYYVSVSGAYGIADVDATPLGNYSTFFTPPFSTEGSGGLNLRVGKRVRNWVAFELEYEWMNGFTIQEAGGGTAARYRPNVLTLNSKFILPIPRIQPYLIAGIGLVNYTFDSAPFSTLLGNNNGFAVRAGGGLDAYVTRNIVLFFEGTYLLNTDQPTIPGTQSVNRDKLVNQLNYASLAVGLSYRF